MPRSRDLFTIASEMNLPKTKVSINVMALTFYQLPKPKYKVQKGNNIKWQKSMIKQWSTSCVESRFYIDTWGQFMNWLAPYTQLLRSTPNFWEAFSVLKSLVQGAKDFFEIDPWTPSKFAWPLDCDAPLCHFTFPYQNNHSYLLLQSLSNQITFS